MVTMHEVLSFIFFSIFINTYVCHALFVPCTIVNSVQNVDTNATAPWQPMGCALLDLNILGFADSLNHMIRKVDIGVSQQSVSLGTLAGRLRTRGNMDSMNLLEPGESLQAAFSVPYSISIPPTTFFPVQYAIISDYSNRCIKQIAYPSLQVTTITCGGLITSPTDTNVLDNGDIYITDAMSHSVLLYVKSTNVVRRIAGSPTGLSGYNDGDALTQALFYQPMGVANHASTGKVYIADWLNSAIRVITGSLVTTSIGMNGMGFMDGPSYTSMVFRPRTVRMVGIDKLAIADSGNGAIRILDITSNSVSTLLVQDGGQAEIWGITGSVSSKIYYTCANTNNIYFIDMKSQCQPFFGGKNVTLLLSDQPPSTQQQCGAHPDSTLLNTMPYLSTTGDSVFLSSSKRTLVKARIPPSSMPSSTVLSLPNGDGTKSLGMSTVYVDNINTAQSAPSLAEPSLAIAPTTATNATIYIKTPMVYADTCRIQIQYAVYPENSFTASSKMVVTVPDNGNSVEITCVGTGSYGSCTSTVAECRVVFPVQTSNTLDATINWRRGSSQLFANVAWKITYIPPATPMMITIPTNQVSGIYVDAPRGVLIPGVDAVVLQVFAVVGSKYTLYQWGISVTYDSTVVSFVSVISGVEFSNAMVTHDPASHVVTANTEAKSSSLDVSRQGNAVHIATLTFSLSSTVVRSSTMVDDVMSNVLSSIKATFLVNSNNNQFVTNQLASVYDIRGENVQPGSVALSVSRLPRIVGIYAFASGGRAYTIRKPDGTGIKSVISVKKIKDIYMQPDVDATNAEISCSGYTSCDQINAATTSSVSSGSGPNIVVQVTYGTLYPYPVNIRMFFPVNMRIVVLPTHILYPGEMVTTRVCLQWEGDPSGLSEEVDVTGTSYNVAISSSVPDSLQTLSSSTSSIGYARAAILQPSYSVIVNMRIVTTLSIPAVYAQVVIQTPIIPIPSAVSTIIYTSVSWLTGRYTPVLKSTPAISQEGQKHIISGVTRRWGMLVQLQTLTSSTSPANYLVSRQLSASEYKWEGSIPVNANQVPCQDLTLEGTATYAMQVATRNVDIPLMQPVSITMCCSNTAPKLSPVGDLLLDTGITRSSFLEGFTVSALYVSTLSGTQIQKDVTADQRIVYEVVQDTGCGAITDGRNKIMSVLGNGTLSMRAIFAGNLTSNIVQIQCLKATGIVPVLYKLGKSNTQTQYLYRINCNSLIYQSGRAQTIVSASDGVTTGTVIDNSNMVTYTSYTPSILRKSFSANGFSGVFPGGAGILSASIKGFQGNSTVNVHNSQSVFIQSMVATQPFPQDTFSGISGDVRDLVLSIAMSDGSVISDIFSPTSLTSWRDYSATQLTSFLFLISSNSPTEVNTSAATAILLKNSMSQPASISISTNTVLGSCAAATTSSVTNIPALLQKVAVACNLVTNTEGDVDLGSQTNVPVPGLSMSIATNVDVRIRSSLSLLKAFDLAITFDPSKISVAACNQGPAWSGTFTCSVSQSLGYVQVVGANVDSVAQGPGIHVAVISILPTVANTVSLLAGFRIKVSTSTSSNLPCGPDPPPDQLTSPVPGTETREGVCHIIAGRTLMRSLDGISSISSGWTLQSKMDTSFEARQTALPYTQALMRSRQIHKNSNFPPAASKRHILQTTLGLFSIPGSQSDPDNHVISLAPGYTDKGMIMVSQTDAQTQIYGDTNSDGQFDVTDYLFMQEYYNGATSLGCVSKGGIGCQAASSLNTWQVSNNTHILFITLTL